MSTTITRHCDHCKKEIVGADKEQIWLVRIFVTNESLYKQYGNANIKESQEWCRPCADTLGLVGREWKPPATNPTAPEPTFEDQLREIIRCEIEAAIGRA